ncbi:MAG: EAL domain-containing protein, partial [Blautia sp.]
MGKEMNDPGKKEPLKEYKEYHERTKYRKRSILLINDDENQCKELCGILEEDYTIIPVKSVQKAWKILKDRERRTALILVKFCMPDMDTCEFLKQIWDTLHLSEIPVIVTASENQKKSELQCLESGAMDFVTAPFCPEILKCRIERGIYLGETFVNVIEKDPLTGLYSKEMFYREAERILAAKKEKQYDMIVADVENFKIVNELQGVQTGDKVLCYMAKQYQRILGDKGVCTRIHGDLFAILAEHGNEKWRKSLYWQWNEKVEDIPVNNLVIKYGVYENVDNSIPVFLMCDRAIMAANQIKNKYGRDVSIYDEVLRENFLKKQQIQENMETALRERQFQVYYQPKYDLNDEVVVGAEALVRWIHPELGFMSPADFIPLFEGNGFITKLDAYVWEEVCRNLCKWRAEGKPLIPVSVNISRMDFVIPDLAQKIISLTDRFGIDRSLLHLEITESAYTDNTYKVVQTVRQLQEKGFIIEMDDFGSGYSSLNMLSELSVDILKLDMKFIQKKDEHKKRILGFVISLAKWLNLTTIAEGVEDKNQVDKLKRFGCDYVQGYYYARPMPLNEFEQYLKEHEKPEKKSLEKKISLNEWEPLIDETRKDTILIVEDSEMNREILKSMLKPFYYVQEAENGEVAYRYLKTYGKEISLILLDMIMPVVDGFQFMKLRSEDSDLSGIPVIITSESNEDSELMALQLGADYFVGKPYHRERL